MRYSRGVVLALFKLINPAMDVKSAIESSVKQMGFRPFSDQQANIYDCRLDLFRSL